MMKEQHYRFFGLAARGLVVVAFAGLAAFLWVNLPTAQTTYLADDIAKVIGTIIAVLIFIAAMVWAGREHNKSISERYTYE